MCRNTVTMFPVNQYSGEGTEYLRGLQEGLCGLWCPIHVFMCTCVRARAGLLLFTLHSCGCLLMAA